MTASQIKTLISPVIPTINEEEEEFSIPLNISDLITVCQEYTKLGWQIQTQVENILEFGVEECIKSGSVKVGSLPHIKNFLLAIHRNPYFGDAASQADDCIQLIKQFEGKHRTVSNAN